MTKTELLDTRERILLAYERGKLTLQDAQRQINLIDQRLPAPLTLPELPAHAHRTFTHRSA